MAPLYPSLAPVTTGFATRSNNLILLHVCYKDAMDAKLEVFALTGHMSNSFTIGSVKLNLVFTLVNYKPWGHEFNIYVDKCLCPKAPDPMPRYLEYVFKSTYRTTKSRTCLRKELHVAEIKHTCWNLDVYEPSDDTFLLVDALQQHAPSWRDRRPRCCLELGSGSGFVITSLALLLRQLLPRAACQLLAVDHSPAAVEATRRTLAAHQVCDVEIVAASLLGPLQDRLRGAVDVMVFNPPYVPTPDEEVDLGGIASAWAGGHRGRRVIDRVLPLLPSLLSPRGELFMVTVTENDPLGIIEEMKPLGFQGRVIAQRQADEETLRILHLWRTGSGG